MVVRADITVNFSLSPRLITVAAPSLALSVQDLHDTLRDIEDDPQNMSFPILVSSGGKEDLGGGLFVGVSTTLQNAQLEFQERTIPLSTGTITTTSGGTTVIDIGATFISDGVGRGDLIINCTDLSITVVVTVDLETQLTTKPLTGGIGNTWDSGDSYEVFDIVQVVVSGGNLVAVDIAQLAIEAISPTANVNVVLSRSTSASLLGGGVDVISIDGSTSAARKLGKAADTMVEGTVDTTAFTPSVTEFECDDITEDDSNQFNGRVAMFLTGDRIKLATNITAYTLTGGRGHFTVVAMNEPPADNDTLLIV